MCFAFPGRVGVVLDVLNLLRELNGHQQAAAGNVKAVSCSLPRAGELPDLRVFNRSEGSVRKNACAYLLELKSKLQLNCVWLAFTSRSCSST